MLDLLSQLLQKLTLVTIFLMTALFLFISVIEAPLLKSRQDSLAYWRDVRQLLDNKTYWLVNANAVLSGLCLIATRHQLWLICTLLLILLIAYGKTKLAPLTQALQDTTTSMENEQVATKLNATKLNDWVVTQRTRCWIAAAVVLCVMSMVEIY